MDAHTDPSNEEIIHGDFMGLKEINHIFKDKIMGNTNVWHAMHWLLSNLLAVPSSFERKIGFKTNEKEIRTIKGREKINHLIKYLYALPHETIVKQHPQIAYEPLEKWDADGNRALLVIGSLTYVFDQEVVKQLIGNNDNILT